MDDVTRIVTKAAPVWEPERRNGVVEIGVNRWSEDSQRMVFDSVHPQRYLELLDNGQLKHQRENKPKPEHLPSQQEVKAFLEREKAQLSAVSSVPASKPAAITTSMPVAYRPTFRQPRDLVKAQRDVETRLDMLRNAAQKLQKSAKPRHRVTPLEPDTEEEKRAVKAPDYKPKPVVAVTPAFDTKVSEAVIDACAAKVPALSNRNREIIKAAMAGQKSLEGLTEASFVVQFSDMCTVLEIPKTGQRHVRREILRMVFKRYEQLVAEGRLPAVIRSPWVINQELKGVLRQMSSHEKELILKYAHSLKAG